MLYTAKCYWPGVTEDELRLFFEKVCDLSGDYETFVSRLRATGKFKSIFDFGARRTTNMTTTILSDKERREYPRDLYKTLLGMAQDRRKPSGLPAAISDLLGKDTEGITLTFPHALSTAPAQVNPARAGYLILSEMR